MMREENHRPSPSQHRRMWRCANASTAENGRATTPPSPVVALGHILRRRRLWRRAASAYCDAARRVADC